MQSMAFMHFKKRSYKQALPALKYVAETHKKSGRNYGEYFAYQCIGQCYLSLGQYEEALPWYEKAVNGMLSLYGNKLNRIDPETRSGYVTVLQKLGKQEQSKEVLKSLSLENLASLINFYQDENLPVEAKRVESQLVERQSL